MHLCDNTRADERNPNPIHRNSSPLGEPIEATGVLSNMPSRSRSSRMGSIDGVIQPAAIRVINRNPFPITAQQFVKMHGYSIELGTDLRDFMPVSPVPYARTMTAQLRGATLRLTGSLAVVSGWNGLRTSAS